jgi:uncharacterized protein YecT (DUF1311 family)
MKAIAWAFAGTILLATSWAGAAGATSPDYDKCVDKTEGVTSAMRDCATIEGDRQDRELNALYKQAMGLRDAAAREQLRLQERAWLKMRSAQCHKVLMENDGTGALLDSDGCWLDLTDKRIAELRALANGHP